MTIRLSGKCFIIVAASVLALAAPLAQERLVINVGKTNRPQSNSNVIHYQGTGSVRHSEQRTYERAQDRHSIQVAESRTEGQFAEERRTTGAKDRTEVQSAQDRTYSKATDRHGSVRLDTIR
jgi:hypothetical protein